MKRSFTLIETLAATALAALLMLAMLALIEAIGRTNTAMARSDGHRDERCRRIADLIALDLRHADEVTRDDAGRRLVLVGPVGLNERTLEPVHRPAEVVYELCPVARTPRFDVGEEARRRDANAQSPVTWLVRKQANDDVPTNRHTWSQLVCAGVNRLELAPARTASRPTDQAPRGPATDQSPAGYRLRIVLDDGTTFEQLLVVH